MSNLLCKCQVCGALLDEEDLFCTECGTEAPVQQQVTQTKLPTYDSTHNFTCQGCGASMSYDAQARGLRCPFCGSESMQADDDAKEIQPSYIVPFVLDRQQAIQCLRQQLARSFWSPNDTSQQAVVDKIQPFMSLIGPFQHIPKRFGPLIVVRLQPRSCELVSGIRRTSRALRKHFNLLQQCSDHC